MAPEELAIPAPVLPKQPQANENGSDIVQIETEKGNADPKGSSKPARTPPRRSLRHPFAKHDRLDSASRGILPAVAKVKGHGAKKARGDDDADGDDEEEEIGIHMWENRGKLVLEVPWFRRHKEA